MITGHALEKIINGPAHHTLHHLYFTVNYGQVSEINTSPSPYSFYRYSTSHGQIALVIHIVSLKATSTRSSRSKYAIAQMPPRKKSSKRMLFSDINVPYDYSYPGQSIIPNYLEPELTIRAVY